MIETSLIHQSISKGQ